MESNYSPELPDSEETSDILGLPYCSMENSAKKIMLMTNNTSSINTEIKVNGQKLETVTSFKYLGTLLTDEVS